MAGRTELAPIALRKQALVLEAQVQRAALGEAYGHLRARTGWIGRALDATASPSLRAVRPGLWALAAAPVAGLALALLALGRRRPSGSWLTFLKWIPPVLAMGKALMAARRSIRGSAPASPSAPKPA